MLNGFGRIGRNRLNTWQLMVIITVTIAGEPTRKTVVFDNMLHLQQSEITKWATIPQHCPTHHGVGDAEVLRILKAFDGRFILRKTDDVFHTPTSGNLRKRAAVSPITSVYWSSVISGVNSRIILVSGP